MATIAPIEVKDSATRPNTRIIKWTHTLDGDVARGVSLVDYGDDITIQVVGTVVVGVLQGSNDSTDGSDGTWVTIPVYGPTGAIAASNLATMSMMHMLFRPKYVRPSITDLTGDVTITAVGSRNLRG